VEETATDHRIVIQPRFADEEAFQSGRASFPRKVYVELVLPHAEPSIQVTVSWFGKPPTRLPEALWLTFQPKAADTKGWTLDKSNEAVSPSEVVVSGNRHMHALTRGFAYREGQQGFEVDTLDAPVVALGERTPLLFSNDQPPLQQRVGHQLHHVVWGRCAVPVRGESMSDALNDRPRAERSRPGPCTIKG